MAANTQSHDTNIDAIVDYCKYRVGDGLYNAYSYENTTLTQEYRNVGIDNDQHNHFHTLAAQLATHHQQLPDHHTTTHQSILHLHDTYCAVQLIFSKTTGLILFFDKSLASNHTTFVEACFDKA